MKKINLLDILGLTNNEIINRAIETDSAEKLKELKLLERRKKYSGLFRYTAIFASGFAIFIIGLVMFKNLNNENVLIPNPMVEVKDINELSQYIKLDLSKYKIKNIKEMYKFENENLIQITYTDESKLRISKELKDNSGIYGSTLERTETINDINISIYKLDDTIYATWNNDNYSYSYIFNSNENTTEILVKLV